MPCELLDSAIWPYTYYMSAHVKMTMTIIRQRMGGNGESGGRSDYLSLLLMSYCGIRYLVYIRGSNARLQYD